MKEILEAVEQEEKLCNIVETIRKLTYLGDSMSTGGGCVVVVTARTRRECAKLRECSELQYGKRFPSKVKGLVYRGFARP